LEELADNDHGTCEFEHSNALGISLILPDFWQISGRLTNSCRIF